VSEKEAFDRIKAEVASWPGVTHGIGKRGEYSFKVGAKEIGHLHGGRAAHIMFPKETWRQLHAEGRIDHHPVFPGREGPGSRLIQDEDDVRDVIAMMRLNYERAAPAVTSV